MNSFLKLMFVCLIISAFIVSLPTASPARTIVVGYSAGSDYSDLSSAFAVVTTGDTIVMRPGYYFESVAPSWATDSVTLTAQIFGTVTIFNAGSVASTAYNGAPTFGNTILFGYGATNWVVQGLTVYGNPGVDCFQQWNNSTGNLILDCLVIGKLATDTTAGPAFGNILAYTGSQALKVKHCTIVNSDNQGIRHSRDGTSAGWEVMDNIFANLRLGIDRNGDAGALGWDGISNNYNLFYNCFENLTSTSGVNTPGANDLLNVNPLFVGLSTDFHLQASSPAIGSGSGGSTRGARWLAPEAGTNSNTLFLNHFNSVNTTQADYAKAVSGPINAIVGTRPYDAVTTKFGNGSLLTASGLGLTGSDQTYSLYTNGQWVWNPHEWTLDWWVFQSAFDAGYIAFGPFIYAPGFSNDTAVDLRVQRTSGYVLQPYMAVTAYANIVVHSVDSSVILPIHPAGQWAHYAWVVSSLKDRSDFYVNGQLVSSTLGNVSTSTYAMSDANWHNNIFHMFGLQGNAGYQFSGGHIDEMRISDIDRYNGASFEPNGAAYTGFTTPVDDWALFDRNM